MLLELREKLLKFKSILQFFSLYRMSLMNSKENPTATINKVMALDSQLAQHTYHLEKIGEVRFYTYYAPGLSIYYEVAPFITALRFEHPEAVLASIREPWIRTAMTFNDEKFETAHLLGRTEFAPSHAIQTLINRAKKDQARMGIESFYTQCVKIMEERRSTIIDNAVRQLQQDIVHLKNSYKSLSDIMHSSIEVLANRHKEILEVLTTLLPVLTYRKTDF